MTREVFCPYCETRTTAGYCYVCQRDITEFGPPLNIELPKRRRCWLCRAWAQIARWHYGEL
jgi:hypothetical protein